MAVTPDSLNVIGLISGGKDSFFSLLHCLANGHRIIALANLHPPRSSPLSSTTEDPNSYMYQTAGHALIPLYADAFELPLYRQEILGMARDHSKNYNFEHGTQRNDETEDLLPLLRKVMLNHPEANAVCSGAILSTYQRTRIESVARRLNLIPLSYLWQYPYLPPPLPGSLLDDMAAVGFDVRIVKVASGGLDEELLWRNLMDPEVRRKVEKGVRRFGGSVLGEGGEYETLVVDGPMGFWKSKIEVNDRDQWIGRGGGGEAWVGFREGAGSLVQKGSDEADAENDWRRLIKKNELWDVEFGILKDTLIEEVSHETVSLKSQDLITKQTQWKARPSIVRSQATLHLSNFTTSGSASLVSKQMVSINATLVDILKGFNRSTDDIVFTTIFLRTITDFAAVNSVYGQLFTKPNPPARVTVACGDSLPQGVDVMVSIVVDLASRADREGLHVQSRSYWAPANIGPYSQAISVPSNTDIGPSVYIAGQIPLVPASMEILLPENNKGTNTTEFFQKRACLALQHLWRIGIAMGVTWWTGVIAFVAGDRDIQIKARLAWKTWKAVHQRELWEKEEVEEDGLDAWDRRYGGLANFVQEEVESQSLPNLEKLESAGVPGFFTVHMNELPRRCDIEWQGLGATNPSIHRTSHVDVPLSASDDNLRSELIDILKKETPGPRPQAVVYTPRMDVACEFDVQLVPCRAVYGSEGTELAAGIIIHHV